MNKHILEKRKNYCKPYNVACVDPPWINKIVKNIYMFLFQFEI